MADDDPHFNRTKFRVVGYSPCGYFGEDGVRIHGWGSGEEYISASCVEVVTGGEDALVAASAELRISYLAAKSLGLRVLITNSGHLEITYAPEVLSY